MEEQPSAGDLLQPTAAGFLGLLKVLGVLAILVRLPAYTVELRVGTIELSGELNGRIKPKNICIFQFPIPKGDVCIIYLVEDCQQVL